MQRLLKYEWMLIILGIIAVYVIAAPIYLFHDYNVQSTNYVYTPTGTTNPDAGRYLVNGIDYVVDIKVDTIGTNNSSVNARIMRAGFDRDFAPIMDLTFTQAPVRVEIPVYEPMAYVAVGLANAQAYSFGPGTANKASVKIDSYNPK